MKYNIKKIILFAGLLLAFTACEDNRQEGLPPDGVCLLESDWQSTPMYNTGEAKIVNLTVSKGGPGVADAVFSIMPSQEVLDTYNLLNGKDYLFLPADCYRIIKGEGNIPANSLTTSMQIEFYAQKIIDLEGENMVKYVLPLQLQSTNGIDVNPNKNWVIYAVSAIEPMIAFEQDGITIEQEIPLSGGSNVYVKSSVVLNYLPSSELTYQIEKDATIDQLYINTYNSVNGTNYMLIPDNAFALDPTEWKMTGSSSKGQFSINIDKSKLIDTHGNAFHGQYMLPLKITSVSQNKIDLSANTQLLTMVYDTVKIDRSNWVVLDWNSDISMTPTYSGNTNNKPLKMLDGEMTTRWQSKWEDNPAPRTLPVYFVFDMTTPRTIYQMLFRFPTGADNWRGAIKKGYFDISDDNVTWTRLLDWQRPSNVDRVNIYDAPTPMRGRYLRLYITEGHSMGMDISELEAWGNNQ